MSENKAVSQVVKAKRDIRDLINSEQCRNEIAKVLPKHLTPERMTRVALTATLKTPKLLDCQPESLMNALLVCSQAGLEPDGRLAHLIPYGNQVQVIFDYKGLVTLALRNGAQLIYADKVCDEDVFDAVVVNGEKQLTHRPDYRKSRGEAVCYYAVCRRAGVTDFEVMSKEEVDAIKGRSRAANAGPWVTDYDEMAKKTVLRRMSKRWDLLPEIRDIINADDDVPGDAKPPVMSSPMFKTQVLPEASDVDVQREDQPATAASAPAQPAASADEPLRSNSLKAVRQLAKIAKISESELLEYAQQSGASDGSHSTLDELPKAVLQSISDNWTRIAESINEVKSKGLL